MTVGLHSMKLGVGLAGRRGQTVPSYRLRPSFAPFSHENMKHYMSINRALSFFIYPSRKKNETK
jgi:hypothetical protein